MTAQTQLPIPDHFDTKKVSEVWRVPYQERAAEAKRWAEKYSIQPAPSDTNQHLFADNRRPKYLLLARI